MWPAVGGVGGRLLTSRRTVTAARGPSCCLPAPPAAPVPAGAQVDGAVPYVTSNDDFYRIDTALYPPQIDPSTWELRIHGMVRNPITITWEQLLRRPMVQRYVTLACVSNDVGGDLIGNALWLGVPIKELLDEAQPLPDADQVVQRSSDGWTCGSPTAVLRDGRDALLAVGMNGEPLPVRHGFPVRMVVPGLYGYVSACKWITEIELTRFADFDAYWVPRGWSALGPIKTQSRIDTPRDGAARPAGQVTVAGVAWAQHRGITKVEVQADNGPWAAGDARPRRLGGHLGAMVLLRGPRPRGSTPCASGQPTRTVRPSPARAPRRRRTAPRDGTPCRSRSTESVMRKPHFRSDGTAKFAHTVACMSTDAARPPQNTPTRLPAGNRVVTCVVMPRFVRRQAAGACRCAGTVDLWGRPRRASSRARSTRP